MASNSINVPLENIIMPNNGRYGDGGCNTFDDVMNGNNFQNVGGNGSQGIMDMLCKMLVSSPGMNYQNGCSKLGTPYGGQQVPTQQVPMQQVPMQQVPIQQVPIQQAPIQQAPTQQVSMQQVQQPKQMPINQLENNAQRVVYIPIVYTGAMAKTSNSSSQMANCAPKMMGLPQSQPISSFFNNQQPASPACNPGMTNAQPQPRMQVVQPSGQYNMNQPSSAPCPTTSSKGLGTDGRNKDDSEPVRVKIECDCRLLENGLDDCRCDKKR